MGEKGNMYKSSCIERTSTESSSIVKSTICTTSDVCPSSDSARTRASGDKSCAPFAFRMKSWLYEIRCYRSCAVVVERVDE